MKTKSIMNNKHGFTLVELMITVFLTAIAVIAIYRGYTAFSQSADAQQQVMEMQQNLRIGMYTMFKDLIRGGMKEEDRTLISFVNAGADTVEFVMDLGSANGPVDFATDGTDNDEDGDIDEEDETRVGDGDITDDGEQVIYLLSGEDLQRRVWSNALGDFGAAQTIITNVSALEFVYLDEDGAPTADLGEIDTVVVTLVVRTTNEDYRITNKETYENLLGDAVLQMSTVAVPPPKVLPPDNFRRRAMSMRMKIRNAQL